MAILSSDVTSGSDILASQYNNLRADLLTGDITIAGVKTFSSAPILSSGIADLTITNSLIINATKKLYLDGGGDTYLVETSPDNLDIYCGNQHAMNIHDNDVDFKNAVTIDGIFTASSDVKVAVTKKIYLDGGGDTYLVETSGDNLDIYSGGQQAINVHDDQTICFGGIAPGNNDVMMWDVVIIALDGASPDTTAYAIDESKVYSMITVGHATATVAYYTSDAADASYTSSAITSDTLSIGYGAAYGASDAAQVIIFYVA